MKKSQTVLKHLVEKCRHSGIQVIGGTELVRRSNRETDKLTKLEYIQKVAIHHYLQLKHRADAVDASFQSGKSWHWVPFCGDDSTDVASYVLFCSVIVIIFHI